jgi:hypothetical protein
MKLTPTSNEVQLNNKKSSSNLTESSIFLKITAPPYTYQIDVVILPKKYAKTKKHPKFLFLVDIISRGRPASTPNSG